MGKVIRCRKRDAAGEYTVTGVVRIPDRTHLRFSFFTSTWNDVTGPLWQEWRPAEGWRPVATYLRLKPDANVSEVQGQLASVMARHMGETVAEANTYHLQPLKRIHLYGHVDYRMGRAGAGIVYVYQMSLIAFGILGIACINFTNLAIARSEHRVEK